MKKLFLSLILCLMAIVNVSAYTWTDANGTVWSYNVDGSEVTLTMGTSNYPTELVIPDKINGYDVTCIGPFAFEGCSNITNVTFPNSVIIIEAGAFGNCSNLTNITIPNSVLNIRCDAFAGCSSIVSINVNSGNPRYDSRSNCNAIIETASNTLVVGCKNTTIPNSIEHIGDLAFGGCSSLESIVIPNSVISLGVGTFCNCTSLRNVTIPNSVTSIEYRCFERCSSLMNVTIPNGVMSIEESAFNGCSSLTNVTIPSSVTSIGGNAFMFCSNLTSVTNLAETPQAIINLGTFETYGTLHVLPGCKAAYEAADYWNYFTIVEDAVGPDGSDGDNPTDLATALYATDSEGCANGSFALPIELKSEFTVKAFQFDVELPDGMSFISDNGAYECNRTNRINAGFSVICNSKAGESSKIAQILCSNTSNPNATISGTSGVVLYIPVNIADGVEDGDYEVAVKNITLVKADGEEYKDLKDKVFKATVSVASYILGDANNSGEVNVADITAVVSHIYGQTPSKFNLVAADVNASGEINVADITGIVSIIYGGSANARSAAPIHNEEVTLSMPNVVAEQGTEVNVPVYINNVDAVSAYQFDLTLPEGVEVKDVHSTSNAHQCLGAYMEDGTYRIMSYSMMNETFINPEVPVGYVTLNVSHDATVGTYDMPLSAATSTANGKENSTHVANGRLIVGNATGISSIDNNGTHADTITTLGGVKMNPTANLPKGIYIINGKKQIIK